MKDELVIVCSPKHRWAEIWGHLTMKTLSSEPAAIILREEGSGTQEYDRDM
ncbi:MAG: hypothetical protein MZU79_00160 [Anaerotruncus sp.]|nr:hypothetical protein [Anaerotruncus sp.]